MDLVSSLYNKGYVFIYTHFDSELLKNQKILNAKAEDIFQELKSIKGDSYVSHCDLTKIKAEIIHQYYEIANENKTKEKLGSHSASEMFLIKSVMDVRKHMITKGLMEGVKDKAEELSAKIKAYNPDWALSSGPLLSQIEQDILNAYRELKGVNPKNRLDYAVLQAERKFELTLSLKDEARSEVLGALTKMPLQLLRKQENVPMDKAKQNYIQNLPDSKIKKFIENLEFQELAKEIDRDMDKNFTVREFAELIGLHYPTRIQDILGNREDGIKKKVQVLGADEIADAYVALLLLQKNKVFTSAILGLDKECAKLNGKVGAIEAALSGPYLAIHSIINR